MDEDYERQRKTDHERVASSGAWLGFGLGVGLLGWADGHMPHVLGFLLNWSSILAVCYAMATWKRAWYAWIAFYGMAALCVTGGMLQLLGYLTSQWSTGSWIVGCSMCAVWYWLVRIPRMHPPKLPDVTHIIHHHVFHGPGSQVLDLGQHVPGLPGSLPAELGPDGRPAVGQQQPRALESYAVNPGAFIGRRGELLARLKQIKGRTDHP